MNRVVAVILLLLAASPAAAQYAYTRPKEYHVEVGVTGGYTLSEGVEFEDDIDFLGQSFDEINPTSGFSYGLSIAYLTRYFGEVGFMFNQQRSTLELGGNNEFELADLSVNNYHGYGAYNFGTGDRQIQPFFLFGLGATQYLPGDFQGHDFDSETKFSTIWGGGVKYYASENIGIKFSGIWTPTYIKTDADGWWCDPFYGCFVTGDSDYSNQFEWAGGLLYRF